MVSAFLWFKSVVWLTAAFEMKFLLCQISLRTLKTSPCDIHENFTSMTVVFNCRGRKLTKMPNITANITSLDLSDNKIHNLTAQDMKNLTYLNLNFINNNHKVTISAGLISNLTNLKVLEMNHMALEHIPEKLPENLQELWLVENKITVINTTAFSRMTNLTYLNLSKNCYYWNPCSRYYAIQNGSFSSLTGLTHLSLSFNNLSHVPTGLPVSLRKLELASNQIAFIGEHDFQQLGNLDTLKIQGNCPRCSNAPYPCVPCDNGSIKIHPQAFFNLVELRLLDLAGNSIDSLDPNWFTKLSKLEQLYLSFNFLSSAVTDHPFLSNLQLLRELDLSFNYALKSYPHSIKLSSSFSNLTSLEILHIQGLVFQEIRADTFSSLSALKNLSVLDVGTNFIVHADPKIFLQLQHLKLLYLSENRLHPVVQSRLASQEDLDQNDPHLGSSFEMPSLAESYTHQKDHEYETSNSLVKPECLATGRVLDLSRNNLFFLSPQQFESFGNISCLNLSSNGFAAAPNGSEFTSLPGIKYLDLSYNKIDLAYDHAFTELQELEVLDLSYNPHYFTVQGITLNLNFLERLPTLKVLNMSFNRISTLTTKTMSSLSLQELQFTDNCLGKLWQTKDKTYHRIFHKLTNLTHLDISYNYIGDIADQVYSYLPKSIQKLILSHNRLRRIQWSMLTNFTQLRELVLSNNKVNFISSNLSRDLPSLMFLDLQYNCIVELPGGFLKGAVNLKALDVSFNRLITINQSTFPADSETYLKTLWLHGNPFHCTCDLLELVLWIYDTRVKIPKLVTAVTCAVPEYRKGQPVVLFEINECIDDQVAFLVYFFSTVVVFFTTLVSIVMHMFYWDVTYIFYYLKARVTGYQYLNSQSCVYDAFITYDTKDPHVSDWVLNQLREQLEEHGERLLPICLEERDWTPGLPVVDCLTQSIQHSRKTVFVLTKRYVNSGFFKLAVFLAHQRLLEDNEDVIVLLLLEPVLQHSHFLRLRRRLCSHSILEWPGSPSAKAWFWQSLRNAIRVDNQAMYSDLYSRYFTTK
ncbi:toll-like receptor 8 [Triplophysa dalaica]|uniref:toll-like receptor 8 n=1 Tax=Triplophysa dalaica TaxID=1582913 RepID=UPI0024DF5F5E|nr:toll-like receptor 8 [Triplophysa dalaica]